VEPSTTPALRHAQASAGSGLRCPPKASSQSSRVMAIRASYQQFLSLTCFQVSEVLMRR
jgi:hypothetical protein